MSQFRSEPIPFKIHEGRRFLSMVQLNQHLELHDFVERFPNSFEFDSMRQVWWFNEPPQVSPSQ